VDHADENGGWAVNKRLESANFLEMRELQLLDVLYATRSVTKSAEQLGQTQPTVSTWLRQIRMRIGDPMFVRTSEGMMPTPCADAVVGKAREILEVMHHIAGGAPDFNPFSSTRTFLLCIPDSAQITLLPRMVQYMRRCAPGVRLETFPVDEQTAHLLETGQADLAFGGFVPGMEAGFLQQALFEQDFTCLISKRHSRIKATLTVNDYRREAHVSVGYSGLIAVIEAAMKRHRIERRVVLRLQGFLGVAKTIALTDMIATLPRQIGAAIAASGSLRQVDCPVQIPKYMLKQHWHARFHRDPGHKWFRDVCAKHAMD
jgi:DNA-binding transcriptional LysR family regulator